LAPRLLEQGYQVRVLARDAKRLAARPWREQVEVCEGDVGDADAMRRAMHGVEVAYYEVVELALTRISENAVETHWSGALGAARTYTLEDWEGLIREVRTVLVDAPPEVVFRTFCSLGGDTGWLVWNWAWRLRGIIDKLVGGPGLRRGRRHPHELLPGEAVDFWRVEEIVPNRRLRLRAEMKTPGKAWLEFEAIPEGGGTRLVQTALFEPRGLPGVLYWYALYPIHRVIFSDLARAVAKTAEANQCLCASASE